MRRPVPGYEGFYEVSDAGEIFSLDRMTTGKHGQQRVRGKQIKPITHKTNGYTVVNLAMNGRTMQHRLHIIVAKVFIPNPENKPTVNHEDGIKSHNWKDNLNWATEAEQMTHAAAHGLTASGDRNGSVKLRQCDLPALRDRILAGELIANVAVGVGVDRNTITKALTKAYGSSWDGTISEKRSRASRVRWDSKP